MKNLTLLVSSFTVLATALSAADTIVDLDFPYNTAFASTNSGGLGNGASDFDNDGSNDDSTRGWSMTTPTANNYGTTDGSTNVGYSVTGRSVTANLNSAVIPNVNSGGSGFTTGSIRLRANDGSTADNTSSMGTATWLAYGQDSWDNLSTGAVSFDGTSSLSISLSNIGSQNIRFLVLADGNYYLSNTTGTGTSLNIANAAAETWYSYSNAFGDPGFGRDILFKGTGVESSVVGSALTNITAVGFYSDLVGYDGSTFIDSSIDLNVTDYVVSAVPEPSSYALISGFLALGWIMLRRRK